MMVATSNDAVPSTPSVLVFYRKHDAEDTLTLLRLILSNTQEKDNDGNNQSEELKLSNEQSHAWTIDNKYYTAEVIIKTICVDDENENESTWDNAEAVVYFYHIKEDQITDDNKEGTNYKELINNYEKILEDSTIETKLCVGKIKSSENLIETPRENEKETKKREEEMGEFYSELYKETSKLDKALEEATRWCLEKEIEHIDIPIDWKKNSDNENKDNDEDKWEVQGINRVLEALHTNMWSSMIMKEKPPCGFLDEQETLEEEVKEVEDPDSLETFLSQDEMAILQSGLFNFSLEDKGEDDGEIEFAMSNNLEKLRAKGQQLPDEQRKELAERVAMQFLNALNDGCDDDDDNEELINFLNDI